MTVMTVALRSIPGTNVALGWAGHHSDVIDRPDGTAGGRDLGFNGGQLLGLAIGGCLCNDLHYTAHRMGLHLRALAVDVSVTFDGEPLLAIAAEVSVAVEAIDGDADIASLVEQATASSTVSNSISRGIPISVRRLA